MAKCVAAAAVLFERVHYAAAGGVSKGSLLGWPWLAFTRGLALLNFAKLMTCALVWTAFLGVGSVAILVSFFIVLPRLFLHYGEIYNLYKYL